MLGVSSLVAFAAILMVTANGSAQQYPSYQQQSFFGQQYPSPSYYSPYYSPSRQSYSPSFYDIYPNYYRSYSRPSLYRNYYQPSPAWQQQPQYSYPYQYHPYSQHNFASAAVTEQRSDEEIDQQKTEAPIDGAVFVPANVNGAFGGSLSIFEASQLANGSPLEELNPTFYPLVGLRPDNPFELAQPRPQVARNRPYYYPQQFSGNNHPAAYYYNYL
jgi:hypothetical protein